MGAVAPPPPPMLSPRGHDAPAIGVATATDDAVAAGVGGVRAGVDDTKHPISDERASFYGYRLVHGHICGAPAPLRMTTCGAHEIMELRQQLREQQVVAARQRAQRMSLEAEVSSLKRALCKEVARGIGHDVNRAY